MSYTFPEELKDLRDFLAGTKRAPFTSARQAAFVAQQLLGTRIKFPKPEADMTPTLLLIQKALWGERPKPKRSAWQQPATVKTKGKASKSAKERAAFTADMFVDGLHIFSDGAAVPNPGVGGWGVAAYLDGQEIAARHGGDPATTNNQMEMAALLNAIELAGQLRTPSTETVTIWSDSQYCVNGVNDWRHKWKKHGWKKGANSPEQVKNVELWIAIDEALEAAAADDCKMVVRWVKGHAEIEGNERADELAEIGRQEAEEAQSSRVAPSDDLDERYRQIMGAM